MTGKVLLRVDPEFHRRLKAEAVAKGVSLNQLLVSRLTGVSEIEDSGSVAALSQYFGPRLVGLVQYGSSVRGEATSSSDLDILCVLETEIEIDRGLYAEMDRSLRVNSERLVSVQLVNMIDELKEPSNLWLEVALEGRILFDPGHRLRKLLYEIKDQIATGVYRRRLVHGQPYWVREE